MQSHYESGSRIDAGDRRMQEPPPDVSNASLSVRMGFIRKFLGIKTSQLVTLVCIMFYATECLQTFAYTNPWMMPAIYIGTLISLLSMIAWREETPTNYILLAVFTLFGSVCINAVVTYFQIPYAVEALLLTIGLFIGMILYTLQSETGFSSLRAPAFMCIWSLLVAMVIQTMTPIPDYHLGVSLAVATLLSVFVIMDIYINRHELQPHEFVVGVIHFYMDVFVLCLQPIFWLNNILHYILSVIGAE